MKQEFQRLLVKMERRVLPSSKEERWSSTFAVPMAGELNSDLCQERQYTDNPLLSKVVLRAQQLGMCVWIV